MFQLLVGIPTYRFQVHAAHVVQFGALKGALGEAVDFTMIDGCNIDYNRNLLVYSALHLKPSKWLLMCDADTYHRNARDILLMLHEGVQRKAAVIAAPVKCRGAGVVYNPGTLEGGERNLRLEEFFGRVVIVERIGTAFMALRLGWFDDHWFRGPWFASEQVDRGDDAPGWVGEDYKFCDEVRHRGGLVLCDGRFEPVHAGVSG